MVRPTLQNTSEPPRGQVNMVGGNGAFKSPQITRTGAPPPHLVMPEKIPIGTYGQLPLDLGWASSSNSSLSSFNHGTRTAINMVGQESNVMGVAHPILGEALKASEVKRFSGRCEDFAEFERAWNHRLKLLYSGGRGPLSDALVLTTLKIFG